MRASRLLPLLLAWLLSPAAAIALPSGAPRAQRALEICHEADRRPREERLDLLARGLELAEQAVEADARDAAAHFAVFCNLGKRVELTGLSLRSAAAVGRLRREIDTTLAHAPGDPDALVAKAAFLLRLPRLLGGDPEEGEKLLDQAIRIAPDHPIATAYRPARARVARP